MYFHQILKNVTQEFHFDYFFFGHRGGLGEGLISLYDLTDEGVQMESGPAK